MNVPNIAQGAGVVTSPDTQTSGGTAAVARAAASSAPAVSFTRLAWFDTNGDGDIDPRPASDGGDATLLVPSHAVALPTYSRHVQTVGDIRAFKLRPIGESKTGAAPNSAQTRQALDAYQRYGQNAPAPAPTPAPQPTSAPTPTPAPAPAAPVVVSAPSEPTPPSSAPAPDTVNAPAPTATAA